MSLPKISISRPVFMTMVLVLLVLLGLVSYQKMDVNEMPDASYPYVSVSVTYEGAQPEQIDEQVVRKIEEAVSEAKGVRHITSTSTEGSADIGVEFKIGIDPAEAAQDVRDKVSAVRGDLPEGVKEPVISRFDMNAAPVAAIALTTQDGDLRELSQFVNDTLKPQLQKVAGVGQIQVSGQTTREVELLLSQEKLNEFGLSISEVTQGLQAVNRDIPAGTLDHAGQQTTVRTAGAFRSLDDVYSVVLGTRGRQPIRFEQVGRAQDTVKEPTTLCRYDGEAVIGVEIGKQSGGNAVRVATDVKKTLARLEKELPAGVSVHLVRDDAARITQSMDDVWFDLIVGGFFAVLIVFWFLGDWHSTVISALAIPTSIAAAFSFMHLGHFSINTMSLLGLSLSVGLLIDDAIVVVENIIRHRNMGKDARTAALDGTQEIVLPVMATTFSVAAVFLPVGLMTGMVGQYFKEFGLTVAFAVLLSLFVSFTLTPMLAALYLPVGKPALPGILQKPWQKFQQNFAALEQWYQHTLRQVLQHARKRVMAGALALLAVSLLVLTQIGQEFSPQADNAQFTLTVKSPRGESVTAADDKLAAVRTALTAVPGVAHVYQRANVQEGSFFIQLMPKAERERTQAEIVSDCRQRVNALAGFQADVLTGDDKPVAISITGEDGAQLEAISHEVEGILRETPGVRDVTSSVRTGASELKIVRKDDIAGELGVSSAAIGETLGTMLNGTVVGRYNDKDEQVDMRLRLDGDDRTTSAMLWQVYVPGTDGRLVPLGQVAEVEQGAASGSVRRYDRKKEVRLSANLENAALSDFEGAFWEKVADLDLPPGYSIQPAGESDDMDEAFDSLGMAIVMAVLLIFLVLAAQFESYSEPFAIMLSLPLAVIGAIWGLFLAHSNISMVSLIGIIMLLGLVTKNAILLIDVARQQLRSGKDCVEALVTAGELRLRPILMTSLAMICGMLPIALGSGGGAELRAPMAYAIIGGLTTSTVLTLVIVPIAYTWIYNWRHH
jgi:HAE1 family hydrophobic/amphiphilic exporter-1